MLWMGSLMTIQKAHNDMKYPLDQVSETWLNKALCSLAEKGSHQILGEV